MPKRTCRHCQARPANKSRGLCRVCYYATGIRRGPAPGGTGP